MSTSSLAKPSPPWLELPREIMATILHKLGSIEILATAEKVCPKWRSVCKEASMWRSIDMRDKTRYWVQRYYDLDKMCRHAVDRKQGQLNHISIDFYSTDDLLLYISERSKQLKSLELIYCDMLSSEGLIEAVKKLPLLEEFHLYFTDCVHVEAIEAIGRSCPHLKSFRFNLYMPLRSQEVYDLEAMAIGKTMHELRHLQLFGHKLTNEGLHAILDGCPHLGSLDLRQCLNVRLSGDLGRLCTQRIKDLRRPQDSADEYDFDAILQGEIPDYMFMKLRL